MVAKSNQWILCLDRWPRVAEYVAPSVKARVVWFIAGLPCQVEARIWAACFRNLLLARARTNKRTGSTTVTSVFFLRSICYASFQC